MPKKQSVVFPGCQVTVVKAKLRFKDGAIVMEDGKPVYDPIPNEKSFVIQAASVGSLLAMKVNGQPAGRGLTIEGNTLGLKKDMLPVQHHYLILSFTKPSTPRRAFAGADAAAPALELQ